MNLTGYKTLDVTPWEAASGGKAVSCPSAECSASWRYEGPAGWYTLAIQYFDQPGGVARFQIRVGDQVVDGWAADGSNPARRINSSSSTRRLVQGIALRPGDAITIEGKPSGNDPAAIDYIEILSQ